MSPDGNDQDKMEIFRARGDQLRLQRASATSGRVVDMEKPPDPLAWYRVLRKRRRTLLTAFFVLFGIVLVGTLKEKPVYRAKALIEIDKESPSLVTPQELLQLDEVSDAYLETQYKVLTSEDLAGRVIRQLGLDRNPEFLRSPIAWPWSRVLSHSPVFAAGPASASDPLTEEVVLARFEEHLDIRPFRRSRAVEIRFDSRDPALAARVVNAVTENYIQKNLEARWAATQKTTEWLSQQLQDLKAKLARSEDDLQAYAAQNGLLYLETDKGSGESIIDQSLRGLQEELTRAQADRYEKESLFRLVQSGEYGSLPGVIDNRLMQDLSERLADLQRERAQLASTFTDEYPKAKEIQSQITQIQSSLDRERERAAGKIGNDYFAALRREKLVRRAFAEKQAEANQFAEKSVQYGILSRDVETNQGLYEGLLQRLKEAGVSAGLRASNIRIVDPGTASNKPVAPIVPLNLGLAAFLGLGLGAGLAFLHEHLDQTVQSAEDVDRFLGVPVLGFIPELASLDERKSKRLGPAERLSIAASGEQKPASDTDLLGAKPRNGSGIPGESTWSEAFRELRTSVILSGAGRAANCMLVTSAQPGEGKTTVAANLAISLAQLGQPVLLVDADLRRPCLQKYFPQSDSRLSAYLAGQGAWQDMVRPTSANHLHVLHCGPVPDNPCELLSSDRMRALILESTAAYRFVILDSPPLLNGADSRILGSMVGATILVVKGGTTPRQVVQYAESQARSVGTNLIGVVLNHAGGEMRLYSQHSYLAPKKELTAN